MDNYVGLMTIEEHRRDARMEFSFMESFRHIRSTVAGYVLSLALRFCGLMYLLHILNIILHIPIIFIDSFMPSELLSNEDSTFYSPHAMQ